MTLLIPEILQILPLLISGGEAFVPIIQKMFDAINATAELTPEQEQARDSALELLDSTDWWQPSQS